MEPYCRLNCQRTVLEGYASLGHNPAIEFHAMGHVTCSKMEPLCQSQYLRNFPFCCPSTLQAHPFSRSSLKISRHIVASCHAEDVPPWHLQKLVRWENQRPRLPGWWPNEGATDIGDDGGLQQSGSYVCTTDNCLRRFKATTWPKWMTLARVC